MLGPLCLGWSRCLPKPRALASRHVQWSQQCALLHSGAPPHRLETSLSLVSCQGHDSPKMGFREAGLAQDSPSPGQTTWAGQVQEAVGGS